MTRKSKMSDFVWGVMSILGVIILIEDVAALFALSEINWLGLIAGIVIGVSVGAIPFALKKTDGPPLLTAFVFLLVTLLGFVVISGGVTHIGLPIMLLMYSAAHFQTQLREARCTAKNKQMPQNDNSP